MSEHRIIPGFNFCIEFPGISEIFKLKNTVMKNSLKIFPLLIFLLSFSFVYAQEEILTESNAPQSIITYVKTNFPNAEILSIKKDKEMRKLEYEVKLRGDTELKFDEKYELTDIESDDALPKSVIPSKLWDYVAANYSQGSVFITGWEKERRRQKLELNNDDELYFDLNGNFQKIDR